MFAFCQLTISGAVHCVCGQRCYFLLAFFFHPWCIFRHFLQGEKQILIIPACSVREDTGTTCHGITELTHEVTRTFILTPSGNMEFPLHLSCTSLHWKQQHPETQPVLLIPNGGKKTGLKTGSGPALRWKFKTLYQHFNFRPAALFSWEDQWFDTLKGPRVHNRLLSRLCWTTVDSQRFTLGLKTW